MNFIKSPTTRTIPKRLIYNFLYDISGIHSHRIFDTKSGEYLGEMLSEARGNSLYIHHLRAFKRNQGVGTALLNQAQLHSKELDCRGNLRVNSSNCYDRINPPHVFYRKYGFDSANITKLKKIDKQILNGTKEPFSFNEIVMRYPAKIKIGGEYPEPKKSFFEKLKERFIKEFKA